jgi:hypothetical protein
MDHRRPSIVDERPPPSGRRLHLTPSRLPGSCFRATCHSVVMRAAIARAGLLLSPACATQRRPRASAALRDREHSWRAGLARLPRRDSAPSHRRAYRRAAALRSERDRTVSPGSPHLDRPAAASRAGIRLLGNPSRGARIGTPSNRGDRRCGRAHRSERQRGGRSAAGRVGSLLPDREHPRRRNDAQATCVGRSLGPRESRIRHAECRRLGRPPSG